MTRTSNATRGMTIKREIRRVEVSAPFISFSVSCKKKKKKMTQRLYVGDCLGREVEQKGSGGMFGTNNKSNGVVVFLFWFLAWLTGGRRAIALDTASLVVLPVHGNEGEGKTETEVSGNSGGEKGLVLSGEGKVLLLLKRAHNHHRSNETAADKWTDRNRKKCRSVYITAFDDEIQKKKKKWYDLSPRRFLQGLRFVPACVVSPWSNCSFLFQISIPMKVCVERVERVCMCQLPYPELKRVMQGPLPVRLSRIL